MAETESQSQPHEILPKTPVTPGSAENDTIENEHENVAGAKLGYNLTSTAATMLFQRQANLFRSPGMNLSSDVYTSNSVDIADKIDSLCKSTIWLELVEDFNNDFVTQGRAQEVEQAILEGLPENMRAAVYLKVANVISSMEHKSYISMLKKARSSLPEETKALLLGTGFPEELQEILVALSFCLSASANNTNSTNSDDKPDFLPNSFVLHLSAVIYGIPKLNDQETLALLLKFDRLYGRLHRDEFYYKLSRTIEDVSGDVFLHMAKQGINIHEVTKMLLHSIFSVLAETEVLTTIVDFILFEGLDYFLRLFGAVFLEQKDDLLSLEGDELNSYLWSTTVLQKITTDTLRVSTEVEPKMVKYENEFHLMSANAISGNYNELSNLKEANDDLKFKIMEFKAKSQNLKVTQKEILEQSSDYNRRVEEAIRKKEQLSGEVGQLQEKYANLTMRENLRNTIQANKDISRGNQELEEQIAELEAKVAATRAKLEK